MSNKENITELVGVIGAGAFGTAIAMLLAKNTKVLLYLRRREECENINRAHTHRGIRLPENIEATTSLPEVANRCTVIFPIIPSKNFRDMMVQFAPYLKPYHILIHGTKGFAINRQCVTDDGFAREDVSTMSEVIRQESIVLRTGCISGPNLSEEIYEGKPTATVIGSKFEEVIDIGKRLLSSEKFHVFGSHDMIGMELAGALKNIFALASGILEGKKMGRNIQALLITRGMMEMIYFGKAMGASSSAFLGTAGIGDLICTATSEKSRNFRYGKLIGEGATKESLKTDFPLLAEGVRTLRIAKRLADHYNLHVPITKILYEIIYNEYDLDKAIEYLMRFPYHVDVDFLE